MTNRIRKPTSSKTSAEIARLALARNWAPVPLGHKSKRPRINGWTDLRVTDDNIEEYFQNGANVGILWGRPSNWAVDVDLDCEEAVIIAPYLFPESTYIYGRRERPRSHYVFRSVDTKTKKFPDPDADDAEKKMLLEIRSTGVQSVWVGSTHPEGDKYQVDEEGDPREMDQYELERRCKQIAATVLFSRGYPKGARHDYVHAVTGALMHTGFSAETTRRMVLGMIAAAGDQEDDEAQRVRTVDNTIKRHEQGGNTQGWPTLEEWLSKDRIDAIRRILEKAALQAAPSLRVVRIGGGKAERTIPTKIMEIPEGFVRDLASWASARSYVQSPQLDLAAALMCTALASSNRYKIAAPWDTPLQPYLMMLAPTGTGKDAALTTVAQFAREEEMGDYVHQGFQSYYVIGDVLAEPPSIVCWLWDEAARKLKTAARDGSPNHEVMTYILEMYGRALTGVGRFTGRKSPIAAIPHPFMTILAAAQPDQMAEAVTQADMKTGWLARFMLFDTGDSLGVLNDNRSSLYPTKISRYARKYREAENGTPGSILIEFEDDKTRAMFKDLQREVHAKKDDRDLWQRANQNALIVAGLLATGRSTTKPKISRELAEYSINLSRTSVKGWIARLGTGEAASTPQERTRRRILSFLMDPLKWIHRARENRPNEKKAMKDGFIPESVLSRLVGGGSKRDFIDALERLKLEDLIGKGEKYGQEVFWSTENESR